MRTAEEMLQASKEISVSPVPCFLNAYKAIEKILLPNEEVKFCFIGTQLQSKNSGTLFYPSIAVSNKRLLIGGQIKGLFKVSYTAQSYDISKINAITESYAMVGAFIVIDTLGDDPRIGMPSRELVGAVLPKLNELIMGSKAESTAATVVNNIQQASAADELKKFNELLEMGIITQEEFDAKKQQLLGL